MEDDDTRFIAAASDTNHLELLQAELLCSTRSSDFDYLID